MTDNRSEVFSVSETVTDDTSRVLSLSRVVTDDRSSVSSLLGIVTDERPKILSVAVLLAGWLLLVVRSHPLALGQTFYRFQLSWLATSQVL